MKRQSKSNKKYTKSKSLKKYHKKPKGNNNPKRVTKKSSTKRKKTKRTYNRKKTKRQSGGKGISFFNWRSSTPSIAPKKSPFKRGALSRMHVKKVKKPNSQPINTGYVKKNPKQQIITNRNGKSIRQESIYEELPLPKAPPLPPPRKVHAANGSSA